MIETPAIATVRRGRLREPFSGVSHLLGAVLSIAALVALLVASHGRPLHVIASLLYGSSMLLVYTASAMHHCLHREPAAARRLQQFDHVAIFTLIAGSFAPICLLILPTTVGRLLLGVEYGLALLGILGVWRGAPDWLRFILYLIMGWLVVLTFPYLHHRLPPAGLDWMIAGGIVYTIGAVIFAADWPHLRRGRFSAHDLWHLFVLGGSACHFILIFRYMILPI
jgi:hemolysin III